MKLRRIAAGFGATVAIAGGGVAVADNQINPYDDKGTHYELPLTAEVPQGEHVEIAKDRPAMTLKGWNNEYAITVEPQLAPSFGATEEPRVQAKRPLLSKRMEFQQGNLTAFVEPKTDNEFDIDFTLDAEPDTNVFTYRIEGAEDFDFFYQPALTKEEVAEGASRPDNVVGSYAVYSKTKANHIVGATNYGTGKIFHIYRPKAIDADGNETWADLAYADGILSVTVPQAWLDAAAFPVRVDPTFGYTTCGASAGGWSADQAVGSQEGPAVSGAGNSISDINLCQNGDGVGTTNIKGFITTTAYAIVAGSITSGTVIATGAGTVITITYAGPSVTNGTTYYPWIIANGPWSTRQDAGGTNTSAFKTTGESYASPSNPTSPTVQSTHRSIYATYTASGGSSPSFKPWQLFPY